MNSSDFSVASIPDWTQADGCVDLAIVLPTYNERENIVEVIAAIEEALQGLRWELIVVDDDSRTAPRISFVAMPGETTEFVSCTA